MELQQLRTFRMVAAMMSFTRAASALGYAQSSVTAQIQNLEAELGVRLFDRKGRGIELTPAGERLLEHAAKMLTLADETRAITADGPETGGSVVVGATESLCCYRLPEVFLRFKRNHPEVRLVYYPCLTRDLRRLVQHGALDVAFVLEEPIRCDSLAVRPLLQEEMALVTGPGHRLSSRGRIHASDISGELILLTELGCSYRNQFEHALIAAGVYPSQALEFSSIEAIKQCVMAGIGIAVLPQMAVVREVREGRMFRLNWAGPDWNVVTQMVWQKNRTLPGAVQDFMEIAAGEMASAVCQAGLNA